MITKCGCGFLQVDTHCRDSRRDTRRLKDAHRPDIRRNTRRIENGQHFDIRPRVQLLDLYRVIRLLDVQDLETGQGRDLEQYQGMRRPISERY